MKHIEIGFHTLTNIIIASLLVILILSPRPVAENDKIIEKINSSFSPVLIESASMLDENITKKMESIEIGIIPELPKPPEPPKPHERIY